ncbi:MAG: iron ABC transporter permease [Candidatus Nanopelagicaceae bacterium]|nr:iron ABC transporter permease [Candidatus Nanopelagicaceae bacterium]
MVTRWISIPIARVGSLLGQKYSVNIKRIKVLWAAPLLFIGVLFYWPLGKILSLGFSGNWFASIATPKVLDIFWFTVWQALLSALISIALGIPGAYVLYARKLRGQGIIKAFITVPFVLPTIVVGIGFTSFRRIPAFSSLLQDGSSIPIIILAHVFMNYSIAVRVIGSTWRNLDFSLEDAASLDGAGRLRTFLEITLPHLKNSIASAFTLIFLYCAASFGIILVLGGGAIKTIETEIYITATQYLDLQKTAGLVFLQSLITAIAFFISRDRSESGLIENQARGPLRKLDRRDLPVVAISATFISIFIALPVLKIFIDAFLFEGSPSILNFANLGGHGARDLLNISVTHAAINSVRNAIVASAVSISIGLLVSYIISRRRRGTYARVTQGILDFVFQAPIGISSVVLGFGYLITFGSGIFPLRSSWIVTPIVASILATPLVIRLVYPALISIDRDLLESASTDGASEEETWWQIEAPIIRTVILTALGFSALISIGEFGAANFLAYGEQGTLPIILYQLISRPGAQNYGMAMAASSLLILFVALVIYLITRLDTAEK